MHVAERYHFEDVDPPSGTPTRASGELVRTDAAAALRLLASRSRKPRLIYIDPPFASNRDYMLKLSGDGESREERVAFTDRWDDGLDGYLQFMESVIERVGDALADDGSLILHCDAHASPYLAVLCDRVFGRGDREKRGSPGFRNELIWSYGLGGSSPTCYPKKHDTLLWYTRSDSWHFDPPRVPATSNRMKGQTKKMPDVFRIPTLNNMARERTGYPTQKPLKLLNMLVRAHTEPGDLVADVFSGSGTTAVAAAMCGRGFFAGDSGDDAIAVARRRLLELSVPPSFEVLRTERTPTVVCRPSELPSGDVWWRARGTFDPARQCFEGSASGPDRVIRMLDGSEFVVRGASTIP